MSLHIYTDKIFIPQDIKVVDFNDSYFNVFTTLDKTALNEEILATIDKVLINSSTTFIGRTKELGALNKSMLSTGTKTLMNIIQHPEVCFNSIECGVNALKFIPRLSNGNVLWKVPVLSSVFDDTCDIILNGEKKFNSFWKLQEYVIDRKGVNL